MSIIARPYAGEADYERIRTLLRTIYALDGPPVYCTTGDLDWWRCTDDDSAAINEAHLWLDGDDVVAIAWPSATQVDLLTHPHYRALEDEMLRWAEQRHASRTDAPAAFAAWGYEGDRQRTAVLQAHGFTRTGDHFIFRTRSLDAPLPAPVLPSGFSIRHVQGEEDLQARVEVHRAAFAPSRMTAAKHRAVMASPTYRSELDLVVVAPDGRFAAFCIVWLDDANCSGMFEPVGCHPDFQRRGLTKALLLEGLRRLQDQGAIRAHVNSRHDAVAANRLYESVGFEELDRNYRWVKQLS